MEYQFSWSAQPCGMTKSIKEWGEKRWTEVNRGDNWMEIVCLSPLLSTFSHIFTECCRFSESGHRRPTIQAMVLLHPRHIQQWTCRAAPTQSLGDVPFVFCRSVMIFLGDVKHGDQAKSWMEFVCSCHCWPLLTPFSCKFLEPAASAASSPIFGPWIFSQQTN